MSMGRCVCVCDLILLACECIKSIINELCNRKILQCVITWKGKGTNTQFDLSGQEVEFKGDNGQREEVTRKLRITRVCVSKLVVNLGLFECRNVD